MKDFVLSLLSRGYGQIVPNEGGHDGRLEVCFEPEDYFNWKSQPPVLHLTSSGRFLGGVEPVPPKTYSTRRGPLILYSEDLALSYQSDQINRKGRAPGRSKQESAFKLHTLQDLTGAILAYGKKQSKVGFHPTHPLLLDTKHDAQQIHKSAEKHYNTRQDKAEKGGQIRYQPHFLCSPRPNRPPLGPLPPITEGLVHLQSQEKSHMASDEQTAFTTNNQKDQQKRKERKRRSLGVVVDTCRAQMSPIPETESTQAELADRTENQTILPVLTDHPKDLNGRGNCSLKQSVNGAGETCTLRSVYMDPTLECSPLSRVSYYGGYMEGSRQTGLPLVRQCGGETPVRRASTETDPSFSILHLPNINQSPLINSTLKTNKPEKDTNSCENSSQQQIHLPDIKVRATYENQPERAVHRKVLLLLPPPTEHTEKGQEPDDDLHVTLPCPVKDSESHGDVELREALTQRGQDPLTDSRCRIIELDLGRDFCSDEMRDDRPPQGPLPPLVGRRGPGKQSSMAVYNQNQHEPADATEPQTGTIRGCLPLELREWQGGKSVGTLIMGPDGEIIRLSLWDPAVETEDHPMMGDVTQGHVLKVVTSEGDLKQPWTIFIQDSTTDEGKFTTHNTEATDSNEEHFDSSPKVLKGNIHAQQTNGKRTEERLDYDSITTEDSQMFVVKTNAKPSNEDIEKVPVGADNKIIKQGEVNTRAEKSIAKKKDSLGSDSKFIERAQVFRANLHEEQAAQMIKKYKSPVEEEEEGVEEEEDCLSSHNNTSKETQSTFPKVCLPEETSEELSSSTAHQPRRTGEEATGVQRTRKVKTTALQPEAGVTAGSRKSKGAAPLISPTSTNLTPTAHSPGESLSPQAKPELQTGLRMEAEKGHSMNTGGTEDADFTLLGKVKKNKKFNKQTSRSKERTGPSHKDVEAQNTRVPDGTSATPKLKKKKIKVEVEKEKEKPIKPQNPRENVKKKKKGQPAFVVGKPRPQDVEHIENQIIESQVDEHERPITQDRRMTPHNTEDDKLENSGAQEHTRVSSVSEDDMDADTHSMSSEMHEPVFSPRSAHSTQRSQHSLITALSEPSTHRLSQNSHRNASAGVATPCSSAPLSLIHLNQKSPHHPASDPAQTEQNNDAKSNEGPTNQTDRKAAALAERAERRRLEVERKRREREEEKKRQQEKEEREERMRMELEEEQRKRAEEARLQRLREEEERQRKEKEEMERQRREQVERERERKRQEEKRRLLERLQRERQEEERRQAADLERQRLEEEARQEEEDRKLSEMKEAERLEYLHRQQEEEEERRRAAEERRRREKEAVIHAEEEARLQAELFIRQREALEQHLKFHRGLFVEAGGLEQMQDVSRSWVFSYFTLLKLLGLTETSAHEDTLKDLM